MTRVRQTKQQKAEYDRKRKAEGRKERRLTKPMKLFFKNKYSALYDEFMEFYNRMDNKYPEKKDLTKTQTFKDFLKSYSAANNPAETSSVNISAANNPAETSSVNISTITSLVQTTSVVETSTASNLVVETSTANNLLCEYMSTTNKLLYDVIESEYMPVETSAANNPAETSSVNISAANNPAETSSVNISAANNPAETSTTNNLLFDVIETLFGPGGIDEYIDHMNNIDEGIDINTLDELKLDYEDFNFELECMDF